MTPAGVRILGREEWAGIQTESLESLGLGQDSGSGKEGLEPWTLLHVLLLTEEGARRPELLGLMEERAEAWDTLV